MRFFLIFISFFLIAGSCDHTRLHGEIVTSRAVVKVGEQVSLKLKVPERLEGIHRLIWQVEPADVGTFTEENDQAKSIRFEAKKPGQCVVSVYGFFKQTNPQPITSFSLQVEP